MAVRPVSGEMFLHQITVGTGSGLQVQASRPPDSAPSKRARRVRAPFGHPLSLLAFSDPCVFPPLRLCVESLVVEDRADAGFEGRVLDGAAGTRFAAPASAQLQRARARAGTPRYICRLTATDSIEVIQAPGVRRSPQPRPSREPAALGRSSQRDDVPASRWRPDPPSRPLVRARDRT
jgi:hypothetical protein